MDGPDFGTLVPVKAGPDFDSLTPVAESLVQKTDRTSLAPPPRRSYYLRPSDVPGSISGSTFGYKGMFEPFVSNVPRFQGQDIRSGLANSLIGGIEGSSMPAAALALPLASEAIAGKTIAGIAAPILSGTFAGLGAKGAGEALGTLSGQISASPTGEPTGAQIGQAYGDLAQSGAMMLAPLAHTTLVDRARVQPQIYPTPTIDVEPTVERTIPNDTQSESGLPSSQPPNAQELRNVQEQGSGTETPQANQAVSLTEDQIPASVLEELRTRKTKVQSNIEQSLSGLKELSGNIRRATTGQKTKEPSVAGEGVVTPTETPPIQKAGEPSVTGGVSGTVYGLTPEEIRAEHQELADMTGEELGPVPEPKKDNLNEFVRKLNQEVNRRVSEAQLIGTGSIQDRFNRALSPELLQHVRNSVLNYEPQKDGSILINTDNYFHTTRQGQIAIKRLAEEGVRVSFQDRNYAPGTSSLRLSLQEPNREMNDSFLKEAKVIPKIGPLVARDALPTSDKAAYDRLALSSKATTVHDALSHMADDPGMFGTEYSAMAGFLADHYEHVLRLATFDEGAGRLIDRANYDPITHQVNLALGSSGISLPFKVLHEAAHAATLWQLEHPRTGIQMRAAETIQTIMRLAQQRLPEEVKGAIKGADSGLAYYFKDPKEFVAGIFSSPELRRLLNSFSYEARTGWKGIVDAVKQLLGVKPRSALDTAFDQLIEVGQERSGIDKARSDYGLDPVGAPSPVRAAAVISDVTAGEKWDAFLNKRKGYSTPKHAAADINVANKLIRYASARIAAPEVARSMATDVLGPKWKDGNFDKLLGAVMVEDRLRAVKKSFQDLASAATDPAERALLQRKADSVTTLVRQPYSGIRDEAQFQALLRNRDITDAIQRHKDTVQPYVEQKHVALGGEKARLGENTDAFVNLRAILAPDDVESLRSIIFGSKKGDLTNPLKRGSSFSKQTSGTGWMYETSYRKLAGRMVRGNYEKYALDQYYKAMVDAGLGYEAAPGGGAPKTAKGKTLEKVEVVRKGTGPGMTMVRNFWIRPDLKSELMQALATDQKPEKAAVGLLMDAATDLQVLGPVDVTSHATNMLGVIAGSPGAKSWFKDYLRQGTPAGVVDGLVRLGYNFLKVVKEDPETQKMIAKLSEVGAGRDVFHRPGGLLSRAVTGVTGVPIEFTRKFDPAAWANEGTTWFLKHLDKAGRVTLNKMFDNLVERGIPDTEANRREFINGMGQYNSRLMPYVAEKARGWGISPFVVAGLNMNRQAVRRLLMSPRIRDASPQAHAKLVTTQALSFLSIMYAFPVLANLAINGKMWGYQGTPRGSVSWKDKEGNVHFFDPLRLLLLRRARRITGLDAMVKGQQQDWSRGRITHEMIKDITGGLTSPWNGPAPRLLYAAGSGRELAVPTSEGYLLSKNPMDNGENIIAALKHANPTASQIFRHLDEGGQQSSPIKNMLAPLGFGQGKPQTMLERQQDLIPQMFPGKTAIEELNPGERRRLEKQLGLGKQPANDLAARQGAERNLWETFAREDALKSSLPQEHQDWLKAQGLKLPGFETELTMGKVRIPGTRQEQETMAENVSSEYQKVISRMMATGQDVTQERLNRALDMARKRARNMFKRGMGSSSGGN